MLIDFINMINGGMSIPLIIVLCGTGIFFTFKFRFVQVRKFGASFKAVFGNFTLNGEKAGDSGMSSFQAMSTAIAAQVGTGNIAGAATAIVAGGPGAIFWMWVSAFFGMATNFAEATLAQEYKTTVEGQVCGGPAYYIRQAFKGKFGRVLAAIFSLLTIFAIGFMGSMIQSNSLGSAMKNAFGIDPRIFGVIIAIVLFFIYRGGVRNIASIAEKMVPIMAIVYIVVSLIVIGVNYQNIIPAFRSIFVGAFNPTAVTGGVVGITIREAIRFGVARGLFSNEAGVGTTPHAHAQARVDHPCDQGLVAMMTVFIDTFIILNMTALVVLTSGAYDGTTTGMELAQNAFSSVFGHFGSIIVAICLFFFAFSTLLGTYFFGEQNIKYLFGKKYVPAYTVIVCILIAVGSNLAVDLVWALADLFNSSMVFPNVLGCLALTSVVCKRLKEFDGKKALDDKLKDVK